MITRNNNTDWNATTAYVSTTRILQVTFRVVVSSSINLVSLPYCVCWNSFCFKLLFTRLFEVSLNPREFPYVLKRMQKFCLPLFNNIKPICAMWPQLKVHLEQFLSFSSFKERDDLLAFLSVMKEILFAQFLENIRLKLKKWKQITTFSNCCSKGGKHPHKLKFVCVANAYFCPFFLAICTRLYLTINNVTG